MDFLKIFPTRYAREKIFRNKAVDIIIRPYAATHPGASVPHSAGGIASDPHTDGVCGSTRPGDVLSGFRSTKAACAAARCLT